MDFRLTPEQLRMVRTVRDLAQSEFRGDALKYMGGTSTAQTRCESPLPNPPPQAGEGAKKLSDHPN